MSQDNGQRGSNVKYLRSASLVIILLLAAFTAPSHGAGTVSVLHSFQGGATDGAAPYGSLILSGNTLYGMTYDGIGLNGGTIFSVHTDGSAFTLLHSFTGGTDGFLPYGSLILSGTALYGMNLLGPLGPGCTGEGCGTIFSVNTNGSAFTPLHAFAGATADGGMPYGSLILSGNALYGMTSRGGAADMGTVFAFDITASSHLLAVTKAGAGSGSVTSSPAGINCGSTCGASFPDGTPIILTAIASSGSSFAGWCGGGCSGTGTCPLTLTNDTTVTATFTASPPPVTPIRLRSFTAQSAGGKVTLQWQTYWEIDNAGFYLSRADTAQGAYTRLNAHIIPAKGDAMHGAKYAFTDGKVKKGKTYYYKMEDIDTRGKVTPHGPVSVRIK